MEAALAFLFVLLAPILLIPFVFVAYLLVGGIFAVVKMRVVNKVVDRKRSHANLGRV
ncbi:MAG: hypothetical protein WBC50_07305 [Dehalococcoidales bacterium]